MQHLTFLIDQGWNVGFYTTQVTDDAGVVTRVFWRGMYKDKEYKSRKGFAEAEGAIKDFIANAEATIGFTIE